MCRKCRSGIQTNFRNIDLRGVTGFSICDYTPDAALIVNNFKEKGITSLSPYLAMLALEYWPVDLHNAILIPVPSSLANTKKRGFSHTALLSKAIARRIPAGNYRELIKSDKVRVDQVGLNPAERVSNMRGAFRADLRGFDSKGRPLVLVDDVLTSGATMGEAIDCLKATGLQVDSFLVFARAGGSKPTVYKGFRESATPSKIEEIPLNSVWS